MKSERIIPYIQVIFAAVLFGVSAPLSKLLLGEVAPVTLAAFLYLGSGISLLVIKVFQRMETQTFVREAEINKSDLGWLLGAVVAGGVAAPIVLLFSLQETPAATASLLLSFEGVATALIAAIFFKEAINSRVLIAILLITGASFFLTVNPTSQWGISLGALGILAACALWGLDNNFTRNISAKNPISIVMVKGLGAGSFSLLLTILVGNRLPNILIVIGAMLLGAFSYGASIVLFIRAMRQLGTARTSALFSTAPLAGVILSLVLFQETPNWLFFVALPLMLVGTLLLVNEKHQHVHFHNPELHNHQHRHDDGHHDHLHQGQDVSQLVHSHPHHHQATEHEHEHLPDIHHRHAHRDEPQGD